MEPGDWDAMSATVTAAMREHVMSFVTPISRIITDEEGELLGTGSYCSFHNKTRPLTNEHVGKHLQHGSLGHQFFDSEEV